MINHILHSSLLKYFLKRLAMAVLVLFLVSVIVFIAVRACPGDPVLSKIGPHGDASEENYNRVAAELGLDKPYPVQYFIWLGGFLRGDFGVSLINGADIRATILEKLPVTLELLVISMVFAILLAIVFGVTSAIYKGSVYDQIIQFISTGFLAIPAFCFGLIVILIFAVDLKILPSMGFVSFAEDPAGHIRHLIMPVLVMGFMEQAALTRYIRSEMLEVLSTNYVRTAKAKGLPTQAIYYKHAFKNVMVTVVTLVGMRIGQLIGGTVVIEQVFGWSGLGWYLYTSVVKQDYPAVQAIVLLIAAAMVILNMLADVLYAAIDPRIKLD